MQLVIPAIHADFILVCIHSTGNTVYGQGNAAEPVVFFGRNRKLYVRPFADRAAAILVNVYARSFGDGNRDTILVQFRNKTDFHIRLHISKAQGHAVIVTVYAIRFISQPDAPLGNIAHSGLAAVLQTGFGDLIAAFGLHPDVYIIPALYFDTSAAHIHSLITTHTDDKRLLTRLAVAEEMDSEFFFCGERHCDPTVRDSERIGFSAHCHCSFRNVSCVGLSCIHACHLHTGDLCFAGRHSGNGHGLADAIRPAAADLDAAVRSHIHAAVCCFGRCG